MLTPLKVLLSCRLKSRKTRFPKKKNSYIHFQNDYWEIFYQEPSNKKVDWTQNGYQWSQPQNKVAIFLKMVDHGKHTKITKWNQLDQMLAKIVALWIVIMYNTINHVDNLLSSKESGIRIFKSNQSIMPFSY